MSTETDNTADEIVCTCTGTTYGDIAELVEQGYDLDGIASKKGVLSGCGGCEWDIESFLEGLSLENSHKEKNKV